MPSYAGSVPYLPFGHFRPVRRLDVATVRLFSAATGVTVALDRAPARVQWIMDMVDAEVRAALLESSDEHDRPGVGCSVEITFTPLGSLKFSEHVATLPPGSTVDLSACLNEGDFLIRHATNCPCKVRH